MNLGSYSIIENSYYMFVIVSPGSKFFLIRGYEYVVSVKVIRLCPCHNVHFEFSVFDEVLERTFLGLRGCCEYDNI